MTGRAESITSLRPWLQSPLRSWRRASRPAPSIALSIALSIVAASCISKKEVEEAKSSNYDADFAVVFGETVAAVRELYPNLSESPVKGGIATSWHQVHLSGDATDQQGTQASSRATTGGVNPNNVFSSDSAAKRFFIRFDINVSGGRPWRVRMVGRAAQWDQGNAVPTELRGASRPPWLESRSDALLVAIHRRLKGHAVERTTDSPEASNADVGPRSDPKTFAGIPAAAAQELAGLRDEILRRDWSRLRNRFAPDVAWSLGADPGIDAAMALWQADPSTLDEMQKALDQGCASTGADVLCPKAASAPGFAGYRLLMSQRSGAWKVVSFLSGQ
jgi:hypothetical protein